MKFGRYQYTIMPFGITVAEDVFQRKLDQYFGKIDNVIAITDKQHGGSESTKPQEP